MAHRQQQLIDELVGKQEVERNHTLQQKAQEYYAEHGVPESHRQQARSHPQPKQKASWWRRLLRLG